MQGVGISRPELHKSHVGGLGQLGDDLHVGEEPAREQRKRWNINDRNVEFERNACKRNVNA